jgi:hypothetical protein
MNKCPYCLEEVNEEARVCKACGRWVDHPRECPFCKEPFASDALKCPHCASLVTEKALARLKPKQPAEGEPVERKIASSPIGAFLTLLSLTSIVYPPELTVTREYILLRRWTLLGLRVFDQKISTRKVASVRFNKGIIWASITIETHGGAMADLTVPALDPGPARELVTTIESVSRTGQNEDDDSLY